MANTDGLDDWFAQALLRMLADAPGQVAITSGFRSVAQQQVLWDRAIDRYGSEQAARRWVAPPGRSNHNHGVAADLSFADAATRSWMHSNAARYGLAFPMDHEPWHIEPAGVRNGTYQAGNGHHADPEAYTTPLPGLPQGGARTFDQAVSVARSMMAGAMSERRTVTRPTLTQPSGGIDTTMEV